MASVTSLSGYALSMTGVIFAIGLALRFPPFPRMIRVIDGLLIGIGGIWLAWSLWRRHGACLPGAYVQAGIPGAATG